MWPHKKESKPKKVRTYEDGILSNELKQQIDRQYFTSDPNWGRYFSAGDIAEIAAEVVTEILKKQKDNDQP